MVVSSCWVLFSSSPGRTSTASSISFATITMHIYWHDGWLLYASGDVSMVECAYTGDSSNLYSRNCIHPWKLDISIPMHNNCCIYLLQIRRVSANCKRPPLHCYYITSRRRCVCFAICSGAPSQQLYSSSFCKKTFVYWVSYRSITVVDCCIRVHTTAHLVVKCHRIFYTKMPPLIVVYV